jgi:hypothetical protein
LKADDKGVTERRLPFLTGPATIEETYFDDGRQAPDLKGHANMGIQINPIFPEKSPGKNRDHAILLIGENVKSSSYLVDQLRTRGCTCEFATSYEAACSLLKAQDFCVVLSPTRLHTKSLLPLMNLLEGSDVTLFYAEPVEQGCWWLPALLRGVACFGSRAVRPGKFLSTMMETLDALNPRIEAQTE